MLDLEYIFYASLKKQLQLSGSLQSVKVHDTVSSDSHIVATKPTNLALFKQWRLFPPFLVM